MYNCISLSLYIYIYIHIRGGLELIQTMRPSPSPVQL